MNLRLTEWNTRWWWNSWVIKGSCMKYVLFKRLIFQLLFDYFENSNIKSMRDWHLHETKQKMYFLDCSPSTMSCFINIFKYSKVSKWKDWRKNSKSPFDCRHFPVQKSHRLPRITGRVLSYWPAFLHVLLLWMCAYGSHLMHARRVNIVHTTYSHTELNWTEIKEIARRKDVLNRLLWQLRLCTDGWLTNVKAAKKGIRRARQPVIFCLSISPKKERENSTEKASEWRA